jgi:Bacterial regulatory protein, Fis family
MVDAFNWYISQEPRVSVHCAAAKFGIPCGLLRGALVLHGECTAPGRRGRQKLPPLGVEKLAFLREFNRSHNSRSTARRMGLSWRDLHRVLLGERGLGERSLAVLDRLMAEPAPKTPADRPVGGRPRIPLAPNQQARLEDFIRDACQGSSKLAAHRLGMSPKTLREKLKLSSGLDVRALDVLDE